MDVRIRTDQRLLVSASMVLAWIATTGLLMAWQAGLGGAAAGQATLARAQSTAGPDLSTGLLWFEHTSLMLFSLIAAIRRRADIMGLLLTGPAIAFGVAFLGGRWFDPSWSQGMPNYYSLGWLLSLVAGAEYWCLFPDPSPGD